MLFCFWLLWSVFQSVITQIADSQDWKGLQWCSLNASIIWTGIVHWCMENFTQYFLKSRWCNAVFSWLEQGTKSDNGAGCQDYPIWNTHKKWQLDSRTGSASLYEAALLKNRSNWLTTCCVKNCKTSALFLLSYSLINEMCSQRKTGCVWINDKNPTDLDPDNL